jgi:hypothetical protein
VARGANDVCQIYLTTLEAHPFSVAVPQHLLWAFVVPPTTCLVSWAKMSSSDTQDEELKQTAPAARGLPKPFFPAITSMFILVQVMFLGMMSYVYGTMYQSSSRAHALNVLLIDYDDGNLGASISTAYQAIQGQSFPSIFEHSPSEYSSAESIRDAVCKGHYWGAVYTHPNASERLSAAYQGGQAASTYDPFDVVSYIYNGARWPVISDSILQINIQNLLETARATYSISNRASILENLNTSDPAAWEVLQNPFEATAELIRPTEQGTRMLYNTVTMVTPILMQFFFIMGSNGIYMEFGVARLISRRQFVIQRMLTSKMYSLVAALVVSGYIWAFKENWDLSYRQWAETWMILWLYTDINHSFIDSLLGTVIKPQFAPFLILPWVLLNVASTIYPFELTPGFYRWAYALPAHEIYTLLVGAWSSCPIKLQIALPVLLAWWLVGQIGQCVANLYRYKLAWRMPPPGGDD